MSVATNQGIAIYYDPRIYTFRQWAELMCEQYAAQNLEIPNDKTDWKKWGNGLKAIDVFTNEGSPSTEGYDDWRVWARDLIAAVNPGGNL